MRDGDGRLSARRDPPGLGLRRVREAAFWPEIGRSEVEVRGLPGPCRHATVVARAFGERVPSRGWAVTGTPLDS